jgi:hypothetical protein
MTNEQDDLLEQTQEAKEEAEFQNNKTRDFIEDHTGAPKAKGPVGEDTSHRMDEQNRLTSVHNMRK